MRVGSLENDMQIFRDAHDAALEILKADPGLTLPEDRELKRRIEKSIDNLGGVLN